MSRTKFSASIVAALCLFTNLAKADNDYMVEKGDSLSKIGKLFGIPYQELMKANNLTSTVIHPDQILRIPAGGRTTDRDLAAAAHAAETKQAPGFVKREVPGYTGAPVKSESVNIQTAYIPPVQGASKARPATPKAPETYTVREGDTVWSISRRFGVDAAEVQKLNKIKFSTIQIGQVLTLPSPVSIAAVN
ncbi:MAG: LysM peptidoglycan-binding domain-containing protein [Verrucomicrobiales bacterium]|nr:LysM peptidoglycan-binding domain-containing protein [Verrucomicrobiales bacterium]